MRLAKLEGLQYSVTIAYTTGATVSAVTVCLQGSESIYIYQFCYHVFTSLDLNHHQNIFWSLESLLVALILKATPILDLPQTSQTLNT